MILLYNNPSHHHLSLDFYKSLLTRLPISTFITLQSDCSAAEVIFVKHKLNHAILCSKPYTGLLSHSKNILQSLPQGLHFIDMTPTTFFFLTLQYCIGFAKYQKLATSH